MCGRGITLHANPKLTLHLKVERELREDGYHNVQILSVPLEKPHNVITISRLEPLSDSKPVVCSEYSDSCTDKIVVKTTDPNIPIDETSLLFRAAKLMVESFPEEIGNDKISIRAKENIPISSGLGGGSADAAAVMKGINELFNLNLSKKELSELSMIPDERGRILGSDVPLCIYNCPCIVKGKGDIIKPLDVCLEYDILLVIPTITEKINKTKIVYQTFDLYKQRPEISDVEEIIRWDDEAKPFIEFKNLGNSFEGLPIKFLERSFELIDMFRDIEGVVHVGLAGAGPTVFFLLDKRRASNVIYSIKTNLCDTDAQIIDTRQFREP